MILFTNKNKHPLEITLIQIKKLSMGVLENKLSIEDLENIDYIFKKTNSIIEPGMQQGKIPLKTILNDEDEPLFNSSINEGTIIGYLSGNSGYLGYHWEKIKDSKGRSVGVFNKDTPEQREEKIIQKLKKMEEEQENETLRSKESSTLEAIMNKLASLEEMVKSSSNNNITSSDELRMKIFEKLPKYNENDTVNVRQAYLNKSTDIRLQNFIDNNKGFKACDLFIAIVNAGLDYFNAETPVFDSDAEMNKVYEEMKQGRSKRKK